MENYNDFQIPHEDTLKLLNESYKNSRTTDLHLQSLISITNNILNSCFTLDRRLNSKIRQAINYTKKELEKLKENLTLTFNIQLNTECKIMNTFNIFNFLRKLNTLSSELSRALNITSKTYYKNLFHNSLISINTAMNEILLALESSTIHLYRYI